MNYLMNPRLRIKQIKTENKWMDWPAGQKI